MYLLLRTFHKMADVHGLTTLLQLPRCEESILEEDTEPIVNNGPSPRLKDKPASKPLDPGSQPSYNSINKGWASAGRSEKAFTSRDLSGSMGCTWNLLICHKAQKKMQGIKELRWGLIFSLCWRIWSFQAELWTEKLCRRLHRLKCIECCFYLNTDMNLVCLRSLKQKHREFSQQFFLKSLRSIVHYPYCLGHRFLILNVFFLTE